MLVDPPIEADSFLNPEDAGIVVVVQDLDLVLVRVARTVDLKEDAAWFLYTRELVVLRRILFGVVPEVRVGAPDEFVTRAEVLAVARDVRTFADDV